MIVSKPKKKKELSRFNIISTLMFVIMGIITLRLLYIQVYKHAEYKERADVGSTRLIAEKAPRGKILDSEGDVLATNIQTYTLTYTQTEEAANNFYSTMDKMFKVLKDNGETYQDDLLIKIDSSGNFYYDFKTDDASARQAVELRFKKDRGLDEKIRKDLSEKDLVPEKGDLKENEIKLIDNELLKIPIDNTFYELVKTYSMYDLLIEREINQKAAEGMTKDQLANERKTLEEHYMEMSAKEITDLLLKDYSITDIRNYMVIKDAIKIQSFKGYRAVTIASNIKKETAFVFYQMLDELPGIGVSLAPIRYYPYKNLASPAIGYISSIDSSQEQNYKMRGYDASSDLIGVAGIEAAFEDQLRGVKGGSTVKVNSKGRVTEELFKLESYPGNNVHLTIDKDVQYAAEQAMKDTLAKLQSDPKTRAATRGAAVAIEVKTGRVISLVSYPDYDPNLFSVSGKLTPEETAKYFNPDLEGFGKDYIKRTGAKGTIDELFPKTELGVREDPFDIYPRSFFNYATQGLIPPGSVFKPLSGLIGLKEGVITPETIIVDHGKYQEHPEIFGSDGPECMIYTDYGGTHGNVNLRKALQVSCNYYFYEVGYRLYDKYGKNIEALDTIAKHAWGFGLGVPYGSSEKTTTGIEIEENFGQTYNFQSFKKSMIDSSLFTLVPKLEEGRYAGYVFVPFDIAKNEDDTDDLKKLKVDLKDKIIGYMDKIGTPEMETNNDKVAKELAVDVREIMKISPKYKSNVAKYESSTGKKVDIDEEAMTVAYAITQYVVNDMSHEIESAAQIIFASIGQSNTRYTPLQIANYTATLANGGTRYKVHLVDKVTSPEGDVIQEFKPVVEEQVDIPKDYLQAIKEGMYAVNTDPANGTAYYNFAKFPIKVAGKTGTADFLSSTEQYQFQGRQPYGNYISFAPLEDPEIAVFVSIYDGKKGSESSSVAKAIYEAYFADRLLKMDPNYASKSATFKKYVQDSPLKVKSDNTTATQNGATINTTPSTNGSTPATTPTTNNAATAPATVPRNNGATTPTTPTTNN